MKRVWVVFGFLVFLLGLAQFAAVGMLRVVESQYHEVDKSYRTVLWDVRFVQTDQTEEDLTRFVSARLPAMISLLDLKILRVLKGVNLDRSFREKADSLLGAMGYYVSIAGMGKGAGDVSRGDVSRKDQENLKDLLAARYRAFKFKTAACDLSLGVLLSSIEDIMWNRPLKPSPACLDQAANRLLALLNEPTPETQAPLDHYLDGVARENRAKIWSDSKMADLKTLRQKLSAKLAESEIKAARERRRAWLLSFNTPEKAWKVAEKFYADLGFDTSHVRLELNPRASLNVGGASQLIDAPVDARVVVRRNLGEDTLPALIHEVGHAVYDTQVRQDFYPYRIPPDNGWYGEAVADLFVGLFFEPAHLDRWPETGLAGLARGGRLRYTTPAATAMNIYLLDAAYHVTVFENRDLPLQGVAEKFLKAWPEHYFAWVKNPVLTPGRRSLYLAVCQLDWLISYPLQYTQYVDGSLFITRFLEQRLGAPGAAGDGPDQVVAVAQALKKVFALGGSQAADELVRSLGVDMSDEKGLAAHFAGYFLLR